MSQYGLKYINVKDRGAKADGSSDDTDLLQSVIKEVRDRTEIGIYLPRGTYKITAPLEIYDGVHIVGDQPPLTFDSNCPDLGFHLSGGTILQGDGTFTAITGNITEGTAGAGILTDSLGGVTIENIGFENFSKVFHFGAKFHNGLSFSVIRDCVFETIEGWCFDLYNMQHINIERCYAFDVLRFARFVNETENCAGGISTIRDCFAYLRNITTPDDYGQRYGVMIENSDPDGDNDHSDIDNVRVENVQINAYGGAATVLDVSSAFTNATNIVTLASGTKADGAPIRFKGADLPNGLVEDKAYYMKQSSGNDYELYTDAALTTQATFSDDGSGTLTAFFDPGDTIAYVCDNGGGSPKVVDPIFLNGISDGILNHSFLLKGVTSGQISVSHLPATIPSGSSHIRITGTSTNTNIINTDPDLVVDVDSNGVPYFLVGVVDTIEDRYPQGGNVYETDNGEVFFPVTSLFSLRGNLTIQGIEPFYTSSNTFPAIGHLPVYPFSQTGTSVSIINTRMGIWRCNPATTMTVNLPDVTTVPFGSVCGVANLHASTAVTVDPNGSQTISGGTAGGTVSVAAQTVALFVADNKNSNENWIAYGAMTLLVGS